jgi:hypothetical protein
LNALDDAEGAEDDEGSNADDGDDDELDPDVAASDAAMIGEVIEEIDEDVDGRLPPLSRADINLGRFSVSKVFFFICVYLFRQ